MMTASMAKYKNIQNLNQLNEAIRQVETEIELQEKHLQEKADGIKKSLKPVSTASGFILNNLNTIGWLQAGLGVARFIVSLRKKKPASC